MEKHAQACHVLPLSYLRHFAQQALGTTHQSPLGPPQMVHPPTRDILAIHLHQRPHPALMHQPYCYSCPFVASVICCAAPSFR